MKSKTLDFPKVSKGTKELKSIIHRQNEELKRLEDLSMRLIFKMHEKNKVGQLKTASKHPKLSGKEFAFEDLFEDHLAEKLQGVVHKINSIKKLIDKERKELVAEMGRIKTENQKLGNKQFQTKKMEKMIVPQGKLQVLHCDIDCILQIL